MSYWENEDRLLRSPTVTEKPDNTNTDHTDSNKEDSNSQQTQPVLDFTQVMGIDGLKFSYEKYERINEIFDGVQNINAGDEKQLLIISFKIENTSPVPYTYKHHPRQYLKIHFGYLFFPLLLYM